MKKSIYGRLFTDLCDHLQAAVPELALIDHDWGQEDTELRPALACPAALIDFQGTTYTGLSGLSQWGEATVTVRLLFDSYARSSALVPEEWRDIALEFYETEHRVVEALHGWMPGGGYCQGLIRTGDSSENRNDIGLRVRVITFSTAFEV